MRDPVSIAADGKSHDSNQHTGLLRNVDFSFIRDSGLVQLGDLPRFV